MRKQTKLVAVLSAAALLAIGATMTSFAATGWQEENGTWVYYDKSGSQVTEQWQKSGDKWFYLDESGEMATDALVEYNNNYYYVDENGAMVTNQWVELPNEDYDGDDDEPVNHWYYFQANGKAMKGSDNNTVNLKTINGKKYTFDDEGRMLYGWVNTNGDRETGDDAWQNGDYYFGDENDGAMTVGWIQLNITDDAATEDDNLDYDGDTAFDDEDQDRWFCFKTNGKKWVNQSGKTINGGKYAFDEYGRMVAEWRLNGGAVKDAIDTVVGSTASQATKNAVANTIKHATDNIGTEVLRGDYSSSWRYYGDPESGARVTKGWFQVVPGEGLNADKYNDDEDKWYYSDNDGLLVASEIKTINGKKYAFDEKGGMLDGLNFLTVYRNDKNKIYFVHDSDYYDTEEEFEDFANAKNTDQETFFTDGWGTSFAGSSVYGLRTYCYYFGSEEDGAMKTGKQTVDIDGADFSFLFNKSGSLKGAGKFGKDDDKYYLQGKLMKADKEDKYSVVKIKYADTHGDGELELVGMELLTTDDFIGGATSTVGDKTYYSFPANRSTDGETYAVNNAPIVSDYVLVNTSGKVVKDKAKAKDGDDFVYVVKNNVITAVYEED